MKTYCLGFMFSRDFNYVLLLKKATGINMGMWNGLGGHVEANETPLHAMLREFEEESGFRSKPEDWRHAADIFSHHNGPSSGLPEWHVKVFRGVFSGEFLHEALRETGDGPKKWAFIGDLHPIDEEFAPHVRSLIHTLRDQHFAGTAHTPRIAIQEVRY